jgi:hypothetical protein
MKNNLIIILKTVLAILLLGCLLDWDYSYFQVTRFVGMIGFIILASGEKNRILSFVWIASAVLINPIFKISLGRYVWNIVDVAWAVILILTSISSIEPVRNYLRNKRIRNLLRNATQYIFSKNGEFDDLINKFVKGDKQSKLAVYSVLEVASLRVPSSEEERLLEALTIYSGNLQKVLNSDFDQVIEIQKTKAEIEFLKTKTAFIIAEQSCIEGDYSFECMRYKMEKAKRRPLTQGEWVNILDKAKELGELDKKIEYLTKQKTDV